MKKSIIYPILLLVTIFAACSKDKEPNPDSQDKSAEVAKTYQGKLTLGTPGSTVEYTNVKVKVTRKAANQITFEAVSGENYPGFTSLTFSNMLYSSATNMYAGSNPGAIIFSFQADATINLELAYNFNNTVVFFEGPSVK